MAMNCDMLERKAADIRVDIIREVYEASSGHPGGSLSAADIITVLYFYEMNVNARNPKMVGKCLPALWDRDFPPR